MDLAASYRALVKKHFPQASIVADRFHLIRAVNHHLLSCWREIDPIGSKPRSALAHAPSLPKSDAHTAGAAIGVSPRKTALEAIYRFKQRLCCVLLEEGRNQKLARLFLRDVASLRCCGLAPLVQLGHTLYTWRDEIACMWRFTRNNGITEGFHTKMEVLQRQAYAF